MSLDFELYKNVSIGSEVKGNEIFINNSLLYSLCSNRLVLTNIRSSKSTIIPFISPLSIICINKNDIWVSTENSIDIFDDSVCINEI
jgi:hypothetical protein